MIPVGKQNYIGMKIYNVTRESSAERIAKLNVYDWQSLSDSMVRELLTTVLNDLNLNLKIQVEDGKIHCDERDGYYFHTTENCIMLLRKHVNLLIETNNKIIKTI